MAIGARSSAVEQWTHNPLVEGPIPSGPSLRSPYLVIRSWHFADIEKMVANEYDKDILTRYRFYLG
jgi:hypothetical protein